MKKRKIIQSAIAIATLTLALAACATNTSTTTPVTTNEPVASAPEPAAEPPQEAEEEQAPTTVMITDNHGTIEVPINPQRVVALDSRTFELLADWDITLAAAPKAVMPASSPYVADESVGDIGNHREPNLELLAAVDPDLVIIGQRFASYYEDVKALVPQAVVIDLNIDTSAEAATPGENLINGLKHSALVLGQIFDKNDEADQLIAQFDQAIATAKAGYNGTDTIMSVIVSGGNIGFSAPMTGRVWGPMYEIFGWVSSLDLNNTTSDHQGDDISVEAIAQSNPDWIFVLDRDAGVSSEDSSPAQDVIDNAPALQNVTAVIEGNIVYAPPETYTNESIQTYLVLFEILADALSN